jgi:hypothetical protein
MRHERSGSHRSLLGPVSLVLHRIPVCWQHPVWTHFLLSRNGRHIWELSNRELMLAMTKTKLMLVFSMLWSKIWETAKDASGGGSRGYCWSRTANQLLAGRVPFCLMSSTTSQVVGRRGRICLVTACSEWLSLHQPVTPAATTWMDDRRCSGPL